MKYIFLTLYLFVSHGKVFSQTSPDDLILPSDLSIPYDFSYDGVGGERLIKAYWPEGHSFDDTRPALIYFHGGDWDAGSYNEGNTLASYLSQRGLVGLTAQYTLTPREELTSQGFSRKRHAVMDAKTVVRWVKYHAEVLGIDKNKLIVAGNSAGGHIGTLQMYNQTLQNPNEPPAFADESNDVAAFIYSTTAFNSNPNQIQNDPDGVNIFNYIDESFRPSLHLIGADDIYWGDGSLVLVDEMVARNQPIEAWLVENAEHNFPITSEAGYHFMINTIEPFLNRLGFVSGEFVNPFMADESNNWVPNLLAYNDPDLIWFNGFESLD